MPNKVFNYIIVICLIGIGIIGAKDWYVAQQTQKITQQLQAAQSTTPQPTGDQDPAVPCSHLYFNFNKGTTWHYSMTSAITQATSSGKLDQSKIKRQSTRFTNKIVEVSPSSVVIETSYDKSQETKRTTLTCKQSGIYGMPFPLLPPEFNSNVKNQLPLGLELKFKPVLFMPSQEKIVPGASWSTRIELDMDIPLVSSFSIQFKHTLSTPEKRTVLGRLRDVSSGTVALGETKLPLGDFASTKKPIATYELVPEIGVSNLDLDLSVPQLGRIQTTLKLTSYEDFLIPSPTPF